MSKLRRLRRLPRVILRGTPRRLATRAAAAAIIAAAGGAWLAAPAQAATSGIFPSCKTPPAPQLPGTGTSGWFEGPPAAGNPFTAHPAATEYQQYGYAGLHWSTYDLGCASFFSSGVTSPSAEVDTQVANWLLGAATDVIALDNTIHGWAVNSSWMSSLDPVVATSERTMYQSLFLVWAGVAIMVVGLTILGRAHRGDFASTASAIGWAFAVLALVGIIVLP